MTPTSPASNSASDWSFPVAQNGASNDQSWGDLNLCPGIDRRSKHGSQVASTSQPVERLPTQNVWGLNFAHATMDDAIDLADRVIQARRPEYFITANLNYLMLVEERPELQSVNQACCCILADGNPIVWRSRWDASPLPCRVAGSDMIVELAKLSASKGYRIFLLGGADGVASAAAEKLKSLCPGVQIAGTCAPPFRQMSAEEHGQLIQRIRDAQTDILLVAFGQPKGEIWIYENLQQLQVPLSIQLGASFDFLAGTAKRAPKFWQMIGGEWLYRAFSDPKRLVPRYAKNISFLLRIIARELRQRLLSR